MRSITSIVCALDLSEHSERVAEYADAVARACGASVAVIYVAPTLTQYLGMNVDAASIDKISGELAVGAEEGLRRFMEGHFAGVEVSSTITNGYPADEIVALAERIGADLIVMGTHGHQGINRILFGSVAEGVVRSSRVPVMTIRPAE